MRLGPFPEGMNNRSTDHALPNGTVRNAVNADFDNEGKAKRRKGATKVYSALGSKGGFSCPVGEFFVEGMDLKKLNANNTNPVLFATGFYDRVHRNLFDMNLRKRIFAEPGIMAQLNL